MTKKKNAVVKTKTAVKTKAVAKPLSEVVLDLTVEFDDLQGKIERLESALNRGMDFIEAIGPEQYDLLCRQSKAMLEYRDTLAVRLALVERKFKKEAATAPAT